MIFLNFFLLSFSVFGSAQDLSQAKMLEGQRLEAIQMLKGSSSEVKGKKKIYSEQFISSQSFQKYQEAKSFYEYQHLDDCLKELEGLNALDQNNIFVLRLKAACLLDQTAVAESKKTYKLALQIRDDDVISKIGLSKISILENSPEEGLKYLNTIEASEISKNPILAEQYVLQKAKLLNASGLRDSSLSLLKKDSEQNLDHIEVLYELANIYKTDSSNYWLARKTYSLFLNRCKRLNEPELRVRKLDKLLVSAQSSIEDLDKKLEVK